MAVWSVLKTKVVTAAERWDAEFFAPENLRLARQLDKHQPVRIDAFADVTDGIHSSPDWVETGGVSYLSAKCVREHTIDVNGAGKISARQDASNPRTRARAGDVIITSVGTIGNAAVVEGWMLPANMDRHLGIIRIRDKTAVDPYYLATFLNCLFGRFQSVRESTGNVQLNLFIEKIKGILVPLSDTAQQKTKGVKAACDELHVADGYYPEAETELLGRLGWEALKKQPVSLSYVRSFSELANARRSDAEFYHPLTERLAQALVAQGAAKIGSFCPKITRGVQPELVAGGGVLVIDSKAVREEGVEPGPDERTSRGFWSATGNAKAHVQPDDVLLNSTGRGTLGRAACYHLSAPAICDNHVSILRPDPAVCDPVYLALYLNSPAGLLQSEQFQTGSSGQLEIYPEHIREFLVFLPKKGKAVDLAWQRQLAKKVKSAATDKRAARQKLDAAKRSLETFLST